PERTLACIRGKGTGNRWSSASLGSQSRTQHELNMASPSERDPLHHRQKMQKALREIQGHLREDIEKVDEPQLKAMFETSSEVLGGMWKAFEDYERKNEAAWRR